MYTRVTTNHGEQFCATKHKDEFIKELKRANHTIGSIEEVENHGLDAIISEPAKPHWARLALAQVCY